MADTKKIAVIFCNGGQNCFDRFVYEGMRTCQAAEMLFGGQKSCSAGCLGFGDCARACKKNAIFHSADSVPVINALKCNGCGDCTGACPKKLIDLVLRERNIQVRCCSLEKSSFIKNVCETGCISCGICVKICPLKAISIENNVAKINFEKCSPKSDCGLCIEKCPTNTINRILSH